MTCKKRKMEFLLIEEEEKREDGRTREEVKREEPLTLELELVRGMRHDQQLHYTCDTIRYDTL